MSGNIYSSGFAPVDVSGIRMQQQHQPLGSLASGTSPFDKVMGGIGMGLSVMGPALDAGLRMGGLNKGAAITGAAIMGFNGGQQGVSTPGMSPMMGGGAAGPKFNSYGAVNGTSAKFLGGPPGPPPGYPGAAGGGMGAPPGFPGGGASTGGFGGAIGGGSQDVSQFDSQINSMMNNNMVFLALQTKVQNVSQMTQMTSNITKADSDAKLNAIRNIRS